MPARTSNPSCAMIGTGMALVLLTGCHVFGRLSSALVEAVLYMDYSVFVVLLGVGILIAISAAPKPKKANVLFRPTHFPTRVLIAAWLGLYIFWCFPNLFAYFNPASSKTWMVLFAQVIIGCVFILAAASKKIAAYGPLILTVGSGFLVICSNFLFAALEDHDSFSAFDHLDYWLNFEMGRTPWGSVVGNWVGYDTWFFPRMLTYLGLGFVLARRWNVEKAVNIGFLVAPLDCIMYWLAYMPGLTRFDEIPVSDIVQFELPIFGQASLVQILILGTLVALGAFATRLPLLFPGRARKNNPRVRRIRHRSRSRLQSYNPKAHTAPLSSSTFDFSTDP